MNIKYCIPGIIGGVILSVIGLLLSLGSFGKSIFGFIAIAYIVIGVIQVTAYSIAKHQLALITSWISIANSILLIIVGFNISAKPGQEYIAFAIFILLALILFLSALSVYFQAKFKKVKRSNA
ncbi:hypothetical protein [Thalassotalea litorea]|uniref:hypothetical protein n=1 Tax=Thalassotalea litorea TaxID=2020715 RepID=UPI00373650D9